MARIRTIKPEFWTDERVGECSVSARLLLIASLNFADDYGGLDRSAKQLKAQVFPYDSIDCEPLVLELLRVGLLIEYQVADRKYLHIKGFDKHQRVENKAKPRIPLYEESMSASPTLTEDSPSPHREPPEELRSLREGNGKEGKGREHTDARASPEIRKVPRETEDQIRLEVLAIKAKYPKAPREDWIAAEKAIRNLIRDGTSWSELQGGVERYAKHCKATNRIVQNPGNWFGAADRPWLQEWALPPTKAENRLAENADVMQQFVGGAHAGRG